MASKHQQYIQDMLETNEALFKQFEHIHKQYSQDAKKYKKEFDEIGESVLTVIRKYENMLCSHSESGKYGKFSSKLSDKFWEAIRGKFPKIDFVGVE